AAAVAVPEIRRAGEASAPRAAVLADLLQRLDDERVLTDALGHRRELAGLHELRPLPRLPVRLWDLPRVGDDLGPLELSDERGLARALGERADGDDARERRHHECQYQPRPERAVPRRRAPKIGHDASPFILPNGFARESSETAAASSACAARPPPRASGARHRIDLGGPFRQVAFSPVVAAILAPERLASTGRAVHALGLALVERDREHRALRLDTHLDARPRRAAVGALEQHADLALEARACRDPDRLGIARRFADVAAIGLTFGIQRLEVRARPVPAAIRATEQTGATDRQHRAGMPAADQDAVHVHGVIVHVLPMAHVLPVQAAVHAADDAPDLDGGVELVGIRRV